MPSTVTMTGPGTAVVVDDAALAIAAQTVAQGLLFGPAGSQIPGNTIAALIQINANLTRIADSNQAISSSLSAINISNSVLSAAMAENNSTQAVVASSQVEANNFQKQVTLDALARAGLPAPVLPDFKEQLKTAVENGISFNAISTVNGTITHFINSTVTSAGAMITGTSAYQTVSTWVSGIKDSILAVLPPSVQAALSNAKAGNITN